MSDSDVRPDPLSKQRGLDKLARIPVKIVPLAQKIPKPPWIKVTASFSEEVTRVKSILREHKLASVCEEASCPNLSECFSHGTATFMIMGEKCTRRCTFCDVAHGRPDALNLDEPRHLAEAIAELRLKYVVITSVDRDDLRDGGASHFASCISETRRLNPNMTIEVLVPDFRGRMAIAIEHLAVAPPDVFNHNLETVPRLYKQVRPGSEYQHSLKLIQQFKARFPHIPTKSGLMLGLGETDEEIIEVLRDLHAHDCDMLTLGQYLQPSIHHSPVTRYVTPDGFAALKDEALKIGFKQVASGPMVRSSYHADRQAKGEL